MDFKKCSILVLLALLISSSMSGLIPDLSSKNLNQGSSGGFASNPFGFNPFQGLKFDDSFFKIPQFNQPLNLQQQTLNQQQQTLNPQQSQKLI